MAITEAGVGAGSKPEVDLGLGLESAEQEKIKDFVKRNVGGKYLDVLMTIFDSPDQPLVEPTNSTTTVSRSNLYNMYESAGLRVEVRMVLVAGQPKRIPASFLVASPETRQIILGHAREAAGLTTDYSQNEPGSVNEELLAQALGYIDRKGDMPTFAAHSLSEILAIRTELMSWAEMDEADTKNNDGQTAEMARLKQQVRIISEILNFWGASYKVQDPEVGNRPPHRTVDGFTSDLANCLGVDPDLFFPERGASTEEAKEVCRGCVVREPCLEYALENGIKFGIWGGLSERERRRIRRQRSLAEKAISSSED